MYTAKTADGANIGSKDYVFVVKTLFLNTPPKFKSSISVPPDFFVGKTTAWLLPEIIDDERDQTRLEIEPALGFLAVDGNQIVFDGTAVGNTDLGSFDVTLILKDEFGLATEYKQVITIL